MGHILRFLFSPSSPSSHSSANHPRTSRPKMTIQRVGKDYCTAAEPFCTTVQLHSRFLIHPVLFKFKPDTTKQDGEDVLKAIAGLKDKVPEVVSVQLGVNKSALSKGFTHGIGRVGMAISQVGCQSDAKAR